MKKRQDIELVIFDLDGTLIDAYPAIIDSFNHAMRGVAAAERDAGTIRRAVGWGDKELLRPFVPKGDFNRALEMYRRHHTRVLKSKTSLYPGARRALSALKGRGLKLAVASNRPTRFSRLLLRHLDIKGYFDFVLCGDQVDKAKPHPGILLKILEEFGRRPGQALYVGDMGIDIEAGRRAGIPTVVVTTGSTPKKDLRMMKPYKVIENIRELTTIVGNVR